jgi:hypothetical protein
MALSENDRKFIKEAIEGSNKVTHTKLESFEKSITELKEVVEDYGDRIRNIEVSRAASSARMVEFKSTRKETCPQVPEIKKINDDLAEYKVIKKYPKFFALALFLFGAATVLLFLNSLGIIVF